MYRVRREIQNKTKKFYFLNSTLAKPNFSVPPSYPSSSGFTAGPRVFYVCYITRGVRLKKYHKPYEMKFRRKIEESGKSVPTISNTYTQGTSYNLSGPRTTPNMWLREMSNLRDPSSLVREKVSWINEKSYG